MYAYMLMYSVEYSHIPSWLCSGRSVIIKDFKRKCHYMGWISHPLDSWSDDYYCKQCSSQTNGQRVDVKERGLIETMWKFACICARALYLTWLFLKWFKTFSFNDMLVNPKYGHLLFPIFIISMPRFRNSWCFRSWLLKPLLVVELIILTHFLRDSVYLWCEYNTTSIRE